MQVARIKDGRKMTTKPNLFSFLNDQRPTYWLWSQGQEDNW